MTEFHSGISGICNIAGDMILSALRVVLDTNVLVATLRSENGASRQIVLAAMEREIRPLISVPLMVEYEAVLKRPDQLAATELTVDEIDTFLNAMAAVADPVQLRYLWRPMLDDPADEMVLETAVNGNAERLVTFNLRDLRKAARRFGILALSPPDFWKEMLQNAKK